MCAILDANVRNEAFGSNPSEAGLKFFDWLTSGRATLVTGGKLVQELEKDAPEKFLEWQQNARLSGKLVRVNDADVQTRANGLARSESCISDDEHIIALAQISGARLLYSKDKRLAKDFTNKALIDEPRGKVYSTVASKHFTPAHRRLLQRTDLCAIKKQD